MAEAAQFNVVVVYKVNAEDTSVRIECSPDTTAKYLLTRCSLDSKLWRLRLGQGSKGWLQDDQPLSLRGVESGWKLRAGIKVNKDQQTHWKKLRKDKATSSMAAASDVPFPDVVGDPDGDSVEDLLVEIEMHQDNASIPDQIGCLKLLVNKLTIDGRLKDAEIARLNAALSAHEV